TPARDALRTHLAAHNIESGVHYPVPIHRQPAWLRAYGETPPLPRAERAAREMLSLPVHPDLADEEVERGGDGVAECVKRCTRAGRWWPRSTGTGRTIPPTSRASSRGSDPSWTW